MAPNRLWKAYAGSTCKVSIGEVRVLKLFRISQRRSVGCTGFNSSWKSCPSWRAFQRRSNVAAWPENSRILQFGHVSFIRSARSTPDISGIITSEISKSGESDAAQIKASRGSVKATAEKPLIWRIVTTVAAMMVSSSTTNMRKPVVGNTIVSSLISPAHQR